MRSLRVLMSLFFVALIGLLPDSGLAAPGDINTVVEAGGGVPLLSPSDVAVDGAGNVYIADTGRHRILKLAAGTGVISVVAGNGTPGDGTRENAGDGGQATVAFVRFPSSVAVDSAGNLFIAQPGSRCVRKVSATGVISTVAGNWTRPALEDIPTRDIGDGGVATSTSLIYPQGVAVDSAGNLYIADFSDHRVRMVNAATRIISTVAGTGTAGFSGNGVVATEANLSSPTGVAVDSAGRVYIADYFNDSIRRVVDGVITTVVGITAENDGTAASVNLYRPHDVAIDSAGNLHIVEEANHALLKVDTETWVVTAAAGTPLVAGFEGDGGPALDSALNLPKGVAVDLAGNIYLADQGNNRIRKISDNIVPVVTAAPAGGSYSTAQTVTLAAGEPATIYYTTDGSQPSTASLSFTSTGQLSISASTTLRYFAVDLDGNATELATEQYDIVTTPTTYDLNLLFAGTGGGSVNGGMSCSSGAGCAAVPFEPQTLVTLMPTPDANSLFEGWSGPCTLEGTNCKVTMDAVKTVTATFNAAPRLKIEGGGEYNLLSAAYGAAASGAVIQARAVEFNDGELLLNRLGVHVLFRGGYDQNFSTRSGSTALKGRLAISNGSLSVDGLVLR